MDLSLIEDIGKGKQQPQHAEPAQPVGGVPYIMEGQMAGNGDAGEFYNPRDAIKRLNENIKSGTTYGGSKMPSAIRESVLNNPLMMPTTSDDMSAFTDRLGEKLGGIQKSMGILEQSEIRDRRERSVSKGTSDTVKESSSTTVDYEIIKMIVENAVEKKLSEMTGKLLTESKGGSDNKLSVMSIGDKFLFLDSDNNVYECSLTFKGKNKARKR